MNKTKKVIFSVMIVLTAGFTYSGYILLGLDDDGATEIDPVLEAQQPGEEIGFKNMAHLIQSFIRSQYERRKENLDQYLRDTAEGKVTDLSKVYQDLPQTNYATRDVHRKTHGCYQADFQVRSHFIEEWNQTAATPIHDLNEVGIFKPGVTYDSIVRFSNGHPQNRDDRMADARGFAVKILPREIVNRTHSLQIQSSAKMNEATILDILSINFPTFFVGPKNTALKYYEINDSFLAGALDFTGKIKSKTFEGLSLFTSGIEALEAQLALSVNGSIIQSPLFQEYFSMVPSRLGAPGSNRAVKYSWAPSACYGKEKEFEAAKKEDWPVWANERDYSSPLHPADQFLIPPYRKSSEYKPDYLRTKIAERLHEGDFCFTLYVQPYLDQVSTNIEDSTDIWLRSEQERSWWVNKIVPSKWSPISEILGFDRKAYLEKIASKKISKPIAVATLQIHQIALDEVAANSKFCEDLSFSPWNGDIVHHKPLGVISRLKRRVYNASRRTRHALNGLKELMPERDSNQD